MLEKELLALIRPDVERLVEEALKGKLDKIQATPWMNAEEAGRYIGISASAVRARATRGKLPSYKDDAGRWLFHRAELDGAMIGQARKPAALMPGRCNFCGGETEASDLAQGPDVAICRQCVGLAVDVLEAKETATPTSAC